MYWFHLFSFLCNNEASLVLVYQVLALAAQELSKPITERRNPSIDVAASTDMTPYPGDNPVHWRQEVEKRIQSKTKRLRKVATVDRRSRLPLCYLSEALQLFLLCFRVSHNLRLRPPQTVTPLLLDTSFSLCSEIMTSKYVLRRTF